MGRQTAIKNSVSNDLRSTFVDSNIVVNCRLCEVFIKYRPSEYIAITTATRNNLHFYEDCSNMNASSFTTFFTHMLRQNGIPFSKELFVAVQMALNIKKP